jgi:hypothetical protein
MFIKLSFTANTRITVPLRMLADIINTASITSVSTLQSRFTSASYAATLTANFDATNSNIIRTTSPTSTSAHVYSYGAGNPYGSYGDISFTIKQPVYDAGSSFIYTQLRTTNASTLMWMDVGTLITGGTMASTQMALTVAESDTSSVPFGTNLTLGGNNYGQVSNSQLLSTGNGFDNVRTFWAYITDKCFFWSVTNGTSYPVGWGTTYADSTKQGGPFFQTQYTRYDYHNTDSNGIFPVLYTNQRGPGVGYGNNADLTAIQNLTYAVYPYTLPLRVNSMVSALPQVGSSWPKLYNQAVHMTMATRSSGYLALNQVQYSGTVSNINSPTGAGGITTAVSTRYPNTTLTGTGFGLMPFGWEANYYGNHGGNATDQCGVYIFNGDYVPGDTFTYNSTVYMIWPMCNGYSQRVGFAVPMV